MTFRKYFCLLILTSYLAIAPCQMPSVKKVYNIKKFLPTQKPIWTYFTSGTTHCFCQADLTQFIDEAKILYFHYFLTQGRTKKHTKMNGYFQNKDTMYAQPYGTSNEIMHKLIYFNEEAKCGVVKVSSAISPGGNINILDLRVWNSSNVATSARPCLPVFQRLSRRGRIVYENMCQREFLGGKPSQEQDLEGRLNPRDLLCRNYG